MEKVNVDKLTIREKIGYALGDGAANIAWRGVATFLFLFYTDVYGIDPITVGLLFLVARSSDGFADILMGILGDRTNTKHGKFRPWILWTALPLGIILSLLFTVPNLSTSGKIIYAFTTYILFMLIYTANNIPYGALMAVMTGDNKERTTIGSYRMVGAFAGGMLVQGALLYLVMTFGNVNPQYTITKTENEKQYKVEITVPEYVKSANVKTRDGLGTFVWEDKNIVAQTPQPTRSFKLNPGQHTKFIASGITVLNPSQIVISGGNPDFKITNVPNSTDFYINVTAKDTIRNAQISSSDSNLVFTEVLSPIPSVSLEMLPDTKYAFIVTSPKVLENKDILVVNQKEGYSYSMYFLSAFLVVFMLLTYFSTKERVKPPKTQQSNLLADFKNLFRNKPWVILLLIGLIFNIYNSIKQGIVVIYFTHYMHQEMLAASYMIGLMLASIGGAMVTSPLGKKFGKKNLFIIALIFSGLVNFLLVFCKPGDITAIFTLGIVSEFAAAIFPTLFFAMLGDAADYSEFVHKRRATGLVYSAGSFATKFGGGLAGAITGFVLAGFNYDGQDQTAIQGAIPGIIYLMSWIPAVIAILGALVMFFYPLNQSKMDNITGELAKRRLSEDGNSSEFIVKH